MGSSPILTYGNRGTAKPGLDPSSHSIVYAEGTRPNYVHGEQALDKDPIPVLSAPGSPPVTAASRINFAIQHPVQHNVKAKDLGCVRPDYIPRLIQYARMESGWGSGGSEIHYTNPGGASKEQEKTPAIETYQPRGSTFDEESTQADRVIDPEHEGAAQVDHDDASRGFASVEDPVASVSTSQAQSVEMTGSDAHKNNSSHSCKATDGSSRFWQKFVEFFSTMLIENAGAYAWAGYAVSVNSADAIEKDMGDLLRSYVIDLSHLATDVDTADDSLE